MLYRPEAVTGDLYQICVQCGKAATVSVNKQFTCYPVVGYLMSVLLMPLGIGAVLGVMSASKTRRATVLLPFCDEHKKHFEKSGISRRSIRATKIDDDYITLVNVHSAFVEAMAMGRVVELKQTHHSTGIPGG